MSFIDCFSEFINCFIGENFVLNLTKIIAILSPIDKRIVKFQSDAVPLSDVVNSFYELKSEFQDLLTQKIVSPTELRTMVSCLAEREEFLIAKPHLMSYILDPKYFGQGFSVKVRREVEDWICGTAEEDKKDSLYGELNRFV